MTDREVMQQALEALTYVTRHFTRAPSTLKDSDARAMGHEAIAALRAALAESDRDWSLLEATQESLRDHMAEIQRLRAALAEPVQEPVAYRFQSPATEEWLLGLEPPAGSRWEIEPLYTTPPQRKPLTEEEIEGINRDLPLLHMQARKGSVAVVFARAIERAHGIGGQDD